MNEPSISYDALLAERNRLAAELADTKAKLAIVLDTFAKHQRSTVDSRDQHHKNYLSCNIARIRAEKERDTLKRCNECGDKALVDALKERDEASKQLAEREAERTKLAIELRDLKHLHSQTETFRFATVYDLTKSRMDLSDARKRIGELEQKISEFKAYHPHSAELYMTAFSDGLKQQSEAHAAEVERLDQLAKHYAQQFHEVEELHAAAVLKADELLSIQEKDREWKSMLAHDLDDSRAEVERLSAELDKERARCTEMVNAAIAEQKSFSARIQGVADKLHRTEAELDRWKSIAGELAGAVERLRDGTYLHALGSEEDSERSEVYCAEQQADKALASFRAMDKPEGGK